MSICWRLAQLGFLATLLTACSAPPNLTAATMATGSVSTPVTSRATTATTKVDAGSRQNGTNTFYRPESAPQTATSRRAEMQRFGIELAKSRNLSEPAVLKLLADARYNATVIRIISPPAPGAARASRSWQGYKKRFVEPIRINQGRAFMQQYATELNRAADRYGVPQNVIAAIIGVETIYGRNQGSFRVLDALATLGFDYPDPTRPDRAEMFRGQLADLIELDLAGRLDARTLKGSYAGAVGIPQFMPGSIKRFAVSAQGTTQIDLTNNPADAIMSVGNYMVEHGWQRGLPVFAPVQLPASSGKLVDGGLKATLDWPQLKTAGARLAPGAKDGLWSRGALGVIDLPEEAAGTVEYRTATPNFFAITQYNHSYFYAASVADLATALEQRQK